MEQLKRKWHTVGLPHALFSRVKRVIRKTGNMSISEYVRWATEEKLRLDELRIAEFDETEKEIKERLAGDSL